MDLSPLSNTQGLYCVANELGDGHKRILKKARDFPNDYTIVYFFGSHELYEPSS